jgi:alanine racemase
MSGLMLPPCNAWLEVDLGKIRRNIAKMRAHVGENVQIMPVLKANAYAAGLTRVAQYVSEHCGVTDIAVASVAEGLQLRQAGIQTGVLVMGGVPLHNIPTAVQMGMMTPAFEPTYLARLDAECAAQGRRARVHIKIDTGLGRIGVLPGGPLDALIDTLAGLRHLDVVGIYTHFAQSEIDDHSFTLLQMERFRAAVAQAKGRGLAFSYIHAFNTGATPWLRDPMVTHVRSAGLVFGYDEYAQPKPTLGLEECMSLRSFVTYVHDVPKGETAGYGRVFKAARDSRIAIVSIGYGDGYNRKLGAEDGAEVIINGRRAPMAAICMDQALIDVTDLPDVAVGDVCTLLGADGAEMISVFEWENKMHQSFLAGLATITARVTRVYRV